MTAKLMSLEEQDTLIHMGDFVRFYAIDVETFEKMKGGEACTKA